MDQPAGKKRHSGSISQKELPTASGDFTRLLVLGHAFSKPALVLACILH
jgi:hypothetical protein